MSIVISNISRSKGVGFLPHGQEGVQYYGVYLNQIPLAEYTHNTEDGMVVCLAKATEALKGVDIDQAITDYQVASYTSLMKLAKQEISDE